MSDDPEIRAVALDAAVESLKGLAGLSPITTTDRLAAMTIDLAGRFAEWIENGDEPADT